MGKHLKCGMATDCAYTHRFTRLLNIVFFFFKLLNLARQLFYCSIRQYSDWVNFFCPLFWGVYVHNLNMRVKICSQILWLSYKELELRRYSIWKYLRPCLSKAVRAVSPVQFSKDWLCPFSVEGMWQVLRVRRDAKGGGILWENKDTEDSFGWGSREGFIEETAFVLSLEERLP